MHTVHFAGTIASVSPGAMERWAHKPGPVSGFLESNNNASDTVPPDALIWKNGVVGLP